MALTSAQKARLRQIASIENAMQSSLTNMLQKQEPDYIARLTINLPQQLQNALGNSYNVAGGFLHQKPLAKMLYPQNTTGKDPEIGDMLVVYKEGMRYSALLLQAKKGSVNTVMKISSGDEHQLELYETWPEFEYRRAGILNGKHRNVSPHIPHAGAQYLVIDESLPRPQLGCAVASRQIHVNKGFAESLYDLILFQTGRPFAPKHRGRGNQWSTMIWDLIDIAGCSKFKRKTISTLRQDRLNDPNKAFFMMCERFRGSSYFSELEKRLSRHCEEEFNQECNGDTEDIPNGGMGVIMIEKSSVLA